jgi:RNA polymerase sigma factor (sigma-70 family)
VNANQTSSGIAQFLRVLGTQGYPDQTDGQLLRQFLSQRDETAFVALVRRHGPMVLGVCRRILGNPADAEDAFQATFLVLVRKAPSLTARTVLGDWLHGVARRTALSARRACAHRRTKEQAMARPEVQDDATQDDWLPLLDQELSRLPENYRLPIVLCDLEGKTRREAAVRLGWPEGTVAGRLARGRALLARRLGRHGGAVSISSLAAALAQNAASACVPEALLHSTAQAASLLAAGTGAATAVISARVAAIAEGVVRAMFLAKLKTLSCVLALTVLVGLGGVALVPGNGQLPAAGPATSPQKRTDARPDSEAQKLVRQLGDPSFAQRQAAEKALTNMGAPAASAVQAGMGNADLEIAKRCVTIWPRLWQAEIARPDADRLAGYTHPLWARFRKVVGDDPGSRTLFAEMAADVKRFSRLEAVEADPKTAGAAYAAELKERAEALERGYQESRAAAGFRTGKIMPASGIPTRGEFAALLFLGTYPATASDESARDTHQNVFAWALRSANPPALRRLFVAWLRTRTAPQPIEIGLRMAVEHNFPEVAPVAIAHAVNDKFPPRIKGFALLAVGCFGTPANLPVLEKAFADSRVFHTTNYTFKDGKQRSIEVQVSDVAVASALQMYGQPAADLGFPLLAMYKKRGSDALAQFYLLGFFDGDTRRSVHKKSIQWLQAHMNDKPKKMKAQVWQSLFDGKTTKGWKTEGQVSVDGSILRIGGNGKGGSIISNAAFARGHLRWSIHHAGDAKATITWRGEEQRVLEVRQGWTTYTLDPAAPGASPIRIVVPPGTTLEIRDFEFMWY